MQLAPPHTLTKTIGTLSFRGIFCVRNHFQCWFYCKIHNLTPHLQKHRHQCSYGTNDLRYPIRNIASAVLHATPPSLAQDFKNVVLPNQAKLLIQTLKQTWQQSLQLLHYCYHQQLLIGFLSDRS